MSLKGNFQSLFLSKSLKRGSSQEKTPTITKPKGSGGINPLQVVSKPQAQSSSTVKYKPLNFMFSSPSLDRKPVFRITSLSQNLVGTAKSVEREESEEQKLSQHRNSQTEIEKINKACFKYEMVIGKGGFGKVWIVSYVSNGRFYALKEMSKAK